MSRLDGTVTCRLQHAWCKSWMGSLLTGFCVGSHFLRMYQVFPFVESDVANRIL